MSNIAIIGDVHANYRRLEGSLGLLKGVPFDLALLTGDVGLDPPWASPARERDRGEHDASLQRVVTSVQESLSCPAVFVPGNHDLRDPAAVSGGLNVDGRSAQVSGLSIVGLGGAGPARFGFPYEWNEDEAEAALDIACGAATLAPDIFLCHTPPAGTGLDRTMHGAHVGSTAVRRRIESLRPGLFVCGHIHESWGFARVGGVPCINAGALGPPAEQDIAWHVVWDNGPKQVQMHRRDANGKLQRQAWK